VSAPVSLGLVPPGNGAPSPRRAAGWRSCGRAGALAGAAALLVACGKPAGPATPYFPLDAGHRWAYDVRTEWDNQTVDHEARIITTEGAVDLAGSPAWRRRSADGVDWYLRTDATGIYRVALKNDLAEQPTPDAQPRYVLKAPVAVGTTWQSSTTAHLLRRRADFPPEIRHSHPAVPMTYIIEAIDEKVAVRAGRFERCVRVKGLGSVHLFADPVAGWRDVPLVTVEWYCPGPGLVKLTRQETIGSTFLSGGVLTMELLEWE
jgi:hypothetical protein